MKRVILAAILLSIGAARASAQVTTSYTPTIYATGTATVVGTPTAIPAAGFVCNQAAPVSTVTVNPNEIVFNDPLNAGKVCIFTDLGAGPLATLPFGAASYEATLVATNSAGSSVESARALPFTHPGQVPSVLTGLRVIR